VCGISRRHHRQDGLVAVERYLWPLSSTLRTTAHLVGTGKADDVVQTVNNSRSLDSEDVRLRSCGNSKFEVFPCRSLELGTE
jgi:hypothetical protein